MAVRETSAASTVSRTFPAPWQHLGVQHYLSNCRHCTAPACQNLHLLFRPTRQHTLLSSMTIIDWLSSLDEFGKWAAGRKPVAKKDDALRFGILGAAKIACMIASLSFVATRWIFSKRRYELDLTCILSSTYSQGADYPRTIPYRCNRRCGGSARQTERQRHLLNDGILPFYMIVMRVSCVCLSHVQDIYMKK